MRAITTFAVIAAAAVLWVTANGAGAGSEDPAALAPADSGPRNQLLGEWRRGRDARYRFAESGGRVSGRALRSFELEGCTIRRGRALFRDFRFVRRGPTADVWTGRAAVPGRGCRLRFVPSTILATSDLRLREAAREGGDQRVQRLVRVRPPVRDDDPVLGTWERHGGSVTIARDGDAYVGSASEPFLIGNGCRVPPGTVVWQLRPSAPDRYDGDTQTFMPPPSCEPGTPARSRWWLEPGGSELVREATDGSLVSYERAG